MAYDEGLANRLREALRGRRGVSERKMFGGLALMLNGNMVCGVLGEDLMARVGPDAHEAALRRKHARPMDFTGKPMKGMVYVSPEGLRTKKQLESWVALALEHAGSLPAKRSKNSGKRTKTAASDPSGFPGFPKDTFRFLAELDRNNDKRWLDAHRDEYQELYVEPARAFVEAMAPRVKRISKGIEAQPKINGSIFRINRDVRFSKDKRPYKAHIDLWFWDGDRRSWDTPGLFMRLMPRRVILGAGVHRFGKEQLAEFRDAVDDTRRARTLEKTLAKVAGAGPYRIGGATRDRVPRGYPADHPRADLLLHEGLFAELDQRLPKEATTAAFPEWCEAHFRAMAPLHRWLLRLTE